MTMKTKRFILSSIAILAFALSSCALGSQSPTEIGAPAITETPAPAATIIVVEPTALQPTPSGSNGAVIYDNGKDIVSIDPATGETKLLISRAEIQLLIAKDRSAESYTYGFERPFPITLAPDLTKALVILCAGLDERLRCVFEYYVYFLESKTALRLPIPPDSYGVYWNWSPDGSNLAGTAWGYDKAFYKLTQFYSVRADGDVLIPLGPITNEHWRIVWNPGNKAIHPMTFATNFQSVFVDASPREDIPIASLEWDDKFECLTFSPDGSQAAFVVRRDNPKDHDRVYISRANFTDIAPVTEYDIKSEYLCRIQWSPDQRFLAIGYELDQRAEAGLELDENASHPGKLIKLDTASLIETRKDAAVCGWTPDNNLILELKGVAGNEGGIEVVNPLNSEPVSLPPGLSAVTHCPILWLKDALAFDVPAGLSVKDACHPGGTFADFQDEVPVPEAFDFVQASAALDGETLTAIMTMKSVPADLSAYLTPDANNFVNGFDILVDVDNNALSGDKFGVEFALSVGILPGADGAAPTAEGVLGEYDPAAQSFAKGDKFTPSFDPDAKTLTVSLAIPGITADSRLVFLSRRVNDAKSAVISDRLCE